MQLENPRNASSANLMTHMEDTFSKGRSYKQPDEWHRVRQAIKDYFQFMIDSDYGLPSDTIDVQYFNTVVDDNEVRY